ncbi:MAG TPA: hypothetical protein PK657_12005 [Legionella sp.]|nr:hypothetical protein [Legionella sp.]
MKLTTYGIWEQPRLDLLNALTQISDMSLTREQIDIALLGPVITQIINTSFSFQQKYMSEHPNATIKEAMLATYEEALNTMLPALSEALNMNKTLLEPAVSQFVSGAKEIYQTNIDYLVLLANQSKEIKQIGIVELYGADFATLYPKLAVKLPYNDNQLIKKATIAITSYIEQNCPKEIYPMMQEHIKYMNEITAQKMTDPEFEEQFKTQTGVTMDEFKANIQNHKPRIQFFKLPTIPEELITQMSPNPK